MRWMDIALFGALAMTGCTGVAQEPPQEPPAQAQPVSLQDIDYQIKITQEFIEKYKAQAYLYDQKAESLLSHDFLGYREAEGMSQQAQDIANDLTNHLQQLEAKRAEMVRKQGETPQKPTGNQQAAK